jgi:hypothetical protein
MTERDYAFHVQHEVLLTHTASHCLFQNLYSFCLCVDVIKGAENESMMGGCARPPDNLSVGFTSETIYLWFHSPFLGLDRFSVS